MILNLAVAAGGGLAIQQPTRLAPQIQRIKQVVLLIAALLRSLTIESQAAEVIPPKPDRYFNDYAGVVSKEAAYRFNEQLAQFERETSDQVVVAVFPKMQTDSDIADYTQRVAQAWGVGQKERRNGVVLFVFVQDRKMFIQVGYGLEGALPDITAFDITEYKIKPHFRSGDYEGGIAIGIDSIFKAIRGEYKGTGKTVAEGHRGGGAQASCSSLFSDRTDRYFQSAPATWRLRLFIGPRRPNIFPCRRWWRWLVIWRWRWRRVQRRWREFWRRRRRIELVTNANERIS